MRNIKLTIEYDGTRYRGWQRLGDSENTIQGKIEKVLSIMANEQTEIIGSGRTDAGAHALYQVANFKTRSDRSIKEIKDYCNQYLPEDIVIKDVEEVQERFHSRYHAVSKKYLYRVRNSTTPTAFHRKYTYHVIDELDIQLMRRAAESLLGKRDFKNFSSVKSKKKSTVRELYAIEIIKTDEEIHFIFHGDGFLYNMARILMGTLLEIGKRERKLESIQEIFQGDERAMAGATVPAHGLYLYKVYY